MIREIRFTVKKYSENSCNVYTATRDDYSKHWTEQGIIPRHGTATEVMNGIIKNQTRWNWTLYDITEENTLTFWKEL